MIRCPECGQEAPDDAKFCDRCGQGLSKSASSVAQSSPTRPTPLAAGASLKNGIEIVALTSQTSIENRYSAKHVRDGKTESIALRERLGPDAAEEVVEEAPVVETPKPAPSRAEDPNGPSAKTAELKPLPAQTNGTATAPAQPKASSGSLQASASGEGVQSAVDAEADSTATALAEAAENASPDEESEAAEAAALAESQNNSAGDDGAHEDEAPAFGEDLGEVFGRVLALSQMISHPAFQRATEGFADNGRVYLVYADEELKPL